MDSQVGDSWAGYSYGFAVHLVLLRSEIVAMKGVCVFVVSQTDSR